MLFLVNGWNVQRTPTICDPEENKGLIIKVIFVNSAVKQSYILEIYNTIFFKSEGQTL